MIAELFETGRMIDLVLILVLAEGVLLALIHRLTGKGLPLSDLVGFLLSGAFLLLALRAALLDAWWGWISLWLLASLITHLADLTHRWRKR